MIEYKNFTQAYERAVVDLWNKCVWFDPITVNKFRKQALFDDNFDPNLCWVALDAGLPVGFVMSTKRKFPYLERGLEPDRGWINVIFVGEEYRRQGVGTHLCDLAENKLKELGTKEITLAAYSPNYFFGGLDEEHYPEASAFFLNRGYSSLSKHYSMGRNLFGFDLSDECKKKMQVAEEKGYRFKHFTFDYSLELLEFLKNEFGGGWKRNALMSMRSRTAEELILLVLDKDGKICGFSMSAIDDNPMRFGPIGIAKSKRNEGLGSVLLEYSMKEMENRGIHYMFFMTTDEPGRRYYERNGLSVIRTCSDYRKILK